MTVHTVIYAALHDPVFLAGTNLGMQLDTKRAGLTMTYDPDRPHGLLTINFGGKQGHTPLTNVRIMHFSDGPGAAPEPPNTEPQPEVAPLLVSKVGKVKVTAQVSDPVRDPVFGKGK